MDVHSVDQCDPNPVEFARKLATSKRYAFASRAIEIAFCQKVVRNVLDGS
jgi:hypothetical protein